MSRKVFSIDREAVVRVGAVPHLGQDYKLCPVCSSLCNVISCLINVGLFVSRDLHLQQCDLHLRPKRVEEGFCSEGFGVSEDQAVIFDLSRNRTFRGGGRGLKSSPPLARVLTARSTPRAPSQSLGPLMKARERCAWKDAKTAKEHVAPHLQPCPLRP